MEKLNRLLRVRFAKGEEGANELLYFPRTPSFHLIYSKKTAEKVFDQIIADMQVEWQEAMVNNKEWLARWVQVRGVLTICITVCVHAVATLSSIFKLVK